MGEQAFPQGSQAVPRGPWNSIGKPFGFDDPRLGCKNPPERC